MTIHVRPTPADADKTRFRIGRHDRVMCGTVAYRVSHDYGDAILFNVADGSGCSVQYTQAQLRDMVQRGELQVDQDWYRPCRDPAEVAADEFLVSELPPREQAILAWRSALTDAVEDLVREGEVKLTDASIAANMATITSRVREEKMMAHHADRRVGHAVKALDADEDPKPGTLRKWVSARRKGGLIAICPAYAKRGGDGRRLNPIVEKIMWQEIDGYLVENGPGKSQIWQRVVRRVHKLNEERVEEGLSKLAVPSRTTVSTALGKLDKFQVMVARMGIERARKEFRPVLCGIQAERPLQVVMIDTHKLDLWSMIDQNDWHDKLSPALLETIEKNKEKHRFSITLAICAATRAIVGVTITPSANTPAAMRTLEMVLSDKGVWADLVGALRPWNMYGLPEKVLTDCGGEFTSEVFRHACEDLRVIASRAMAGTPEMRGIGEGIFRTANATLCRRLAGNTFHEMISEDQPDDVPTGFETAALTIEDLVFAIVRWVVDFYHHSSHEGLLGATPAEEWARRVAEYGVTPPPDRARMRMVFGTRFTRTLSKTGVTVLGIRYHSAQLAALMNKRGKGIVDVRWHPADLGRIAVRTDAGWIDVPSVQPEFEGKRAETWLTAAKHVRPGRSKAKEIDLRVALEAMEAIEARSDAARLVAGLTVDPWDENRLKAAEARVFAGVTFRETGTTEADRTPTDGVGEAIGEPVDPPKAPETRNPKARASKPVAPEHESPEAAAADPSTQPAAEQKPKPARSPRRTGSTLRIEKD